MSTNVSTLRRPAADVLFPCVKLNLGITSFKSPHLFLFFSKPKMIPHTHNILKQKACNLCKLPSSVYVTVLIVFFVLEQWYSLMVPHLFSPHNASALYKGQVMFSQSIKK